MTSSTASLVSSIFEYRTIHGRTYQKCPTTEYWCPNDEQQNDGLDMAHHFITILLGYRLFEAPIPLMSMSKVLDVGTGTGIWAIDMADQCPAAEIIGTDISPIQPPWVPPNCSFQIEDAQLEWTYTAATFDFVHMRGLYGSIREWPHLYAEVYRALQPGGWVEHFEFTTRVYSKLPEIKDDPKHIFRRWDDVLTEAGDRLGKSLRIGVNGSITRHMRDSGFVNIVSKSCQVPVGGWSSNATLRRIGLFNLAFLTVSLDGFALFLLLEVITNK